MQTSIIIPAHNEQDNLPFLIEGIKRQTVRPLEVILVDDCSTDNTVNLAKEHFTVIQLEKNSGPAVARNVGMKHARGKYFGFLDGDVVPDKQWVETIERELSKEDTKAIVGDAHIPKTSLIGDCISALGFPGGGHMGSDKIWKVEADGAMNHITGLNFAIRKEVYDSLGGFDERFSFNCEDADYGNRLWNSGIRIKYIKQLVADHEAIESVGLFIKWHFKRGIGNYEFKQKIGKVNKFIKLRLWSSFNIFKAYMLDLKLPLIMALLFLSFVCQQAGYVYAKIKDNKKK